jgi:hypothetical protein|uniref:hypothetical protein n=1 Tax=Candidatus Ventrimonas sp. TaxID=3048889 RepID=UPI003FEF00A1
MWTNKQKNKVSVIVKSFGFLFGLVCIVIFLTHILTPKYFMNQTWAVTTTFDNFYKIKKNTIDVLFFGSSRAAASFVPQEMYNNYGITSYNLGSEQQNTVVSYYWLKEALNYQNPKAVILDVKHLFVYDENEKLNSHVSCTRKPIEHMKMSSVKREAIKDICSLDDKQSAIGYYFPLYNYHTRWKHLKEEDFSYREQLQSGKAKGYAPLYRAGGIDTELPYETENEVSSVGKQKFVPLMEIYLSKMVDLCREKGVQLILVNVPYRESTEAHYYAVKEYADEKEIPYYDFCAAPLYQKVEYNFQLDNQDAVHSNLSGAKKLTNYMGEILSEEYGIGSHVDVQWEESRDYYAGICKDFELINTADIYEYFAILKDKRYAVFMAASDDASTGLNDKMSELFRHLGLEGTVRDHFRSSYYAIISDQEIMEKVDDEQLKVSGVFRDGRSTYEISSGGYDSGSGCSIKIDQVEYAKNKRGLNIVVYNLLTQTVIDSICFDTYLAEMPAIR